MEKPFKITSLIGKEVAGYHILSLLGRGGMGIVYKALDINLDKIFALKMIDPVLARDEKFVHRFRDEARILARIKSPHIVQVHAMRQTEVGLFIVMEYVDGKTFRELLREGSIPWQDALSPIKQMLTALEDAHNVGVIHRDIKPGNVMIKSDGVVKVMDFGLAKLMRRRKEVSDKEWMTTITQGIDGTLYYLSPEQVKGSADLNHRSDLYSAGMMIYEMFTGDLPFDRDAGEFGIMKAIVEKKLPVPSTFNKDLPRDLDKIIMKALEKEPARRFQNAEEMCTAFEALEQSVSDEKPGGRNYVQLGILAMFVVVLAIVVHLFWPTAPAPLLLSINSNPEGARVYLNGDSIETTPFSNYIIESETYSIELRIEKDGYQPVDTTLEVVSGDSVSLNIPLPLPDVITALLEINHLHDLLEQLEMYKDVGPLTYGEETDYFHPERCYLFIVDPGTNAVVTVLTPGESTRTNVLTGEPIDDISTLVEEMSTICVEVYL